MLRVSMKKIYFILVFAVCCTLWIHVSASSFRYVFPVVKHMHEFECKNRIVKIIASETPDENGNKVFSLDKFFVSNLDRSLEGDLTQKFSQAITDIQLFNSVMIACDNQGADNLHVKIPQKHSPSTNVYVIDKHFMLID